MGLGDTLYLQSIVRHLVEKGERPEVCTKYPDVFKPHLGKINLSPFRRDRVDKVCHYISRKRFPETDQFRDCCINVGITEDIDLRLDWKWRNDGLSKSKRPVVIVQLPRAPMGRADGFGDDLLPDCRRIQHVIDRISRRAMIVQVGRGKPLFAFRGIDVDLANRTTIAGMIDAAATAQGFLGYCSFIAPLAESLKKPLLLVWSSRGLKSANSFIRQMTPKKIFYLPSSKAVMDNCTDYEMDEAANAFLDALGSPNAV